MPSELDTVTVGDFDTQLARVGRINGGGNKLPLSQGNKKKIIKVFKSYAKVFGVNFYFKIKYSQCYTWKKIM